MKVNQQQARQLITNPAFEGIWDDYEAQLFEQWKATSDPDEVIRLHTKAVIAREVKQQLKNTAVIEDGHGTN